MPAAWRLYRPSGTEVPLLVAVLLYYTGVEVVGKTVLPYFTYGVCHDLFSNATSELCLHLNQHPALALNAQKDSVLLIMAEGIFSNLAPLLLLAFCGSWSDRYGRKPTLVLAYLANVLSVVFFLLSLHLHNVPVVAFLIAGFLVRSIIGHSIVFNMMASSCLADLARNGGRYEEIGAESTAWREEQQKLLEGRNHGDGGRSSDEFQTREKLLASLCRQHVGEAVGKVLGSFLAWLCQIGGGATLALLVGTGICLLGMVVVVCWLKECRDLNFNNAAAAPGGTNGPNMCLRNLGEVFSCQKLDISPAVLWGSISVAFFAGCCRSCRITVAVPYFQQPPLSWPRSTFAAFVGCCSAFQSFFLFLIAPLIPNQTVVVVSLLFTTAGGVWMAFAKSSWSMMLAGCFSYMVDCVFPAVKSILCDRLNQNQVGQVLAKLSFAVAFSSVVGSAAFANLYIYTEGYFAGLAFLVSSALPAAVLLVGSVMEVTYSALCEPPPPQPASPQLEPREACQRPSFTQSMDVLSPVVSTRESVLISASL